MAILGIPFGWVMHWLQELIGNYGWTIIVFTVLVRLLMTPLTIKQQKSSAKMAVFQPKLQELQKRYKNNQQRYQEEMMKLYEREGISPTAGCLPMVFQMVFLFGIIEVMYRPLRYILQIPADTISSACKKVGLVASQQMQLINLVQQGTGEKFQQLSQILSASEIARIQDFNMSFFGLDLSQTPTLGFNWLIVIPLLSFASAILMSIVSMKQQSDMGQGQNNMMKIMMFVSPLMSLVFAFQLPAGVGIYWIASNVVSFVSTEIMRRIYTPERLAELASKDKGSERQREKMRKRREMIAKMNETSEAYLAEKNKQKADLEDAQNTVQHTPDLNKQGKPSASNSSQTRKPASPEEMSANDRIAAARKRLEAMYGASDDNNEETK